MPKLLQVWIIGFALLAGLSACQNGNSGGSPSAPELSLKGQENRNASGILSEDTEDSEIDLPQYPQDTVVIAAIGDSITYGQGTWDGGYPKRLENRLLAAGHNVVVLNKGKPGEQSSATDARFLPAIVGADIVLLMTGINDAVNPVECEISLNCQTVAHIESMMDKALVSKIIPVVSTITPARDGDEYEWANPTIQELSVKILSSANQREVVAVNNYQAVTQNGGSALYYDRLHFNSRGYDVIAEQWFNAIEQNQLIQQALSQKKR